MRISDWSSDVCSSDLLGLAGRRMGDGLGDHGDVLAARNLQRHVDVEVPALADHADCIGARVQQGGKTGIVVGAAPGPARHAEGDRSEEHTSELQSLMRISYAVFCLKKKNKINTQ